MKGVVVKEADNREIVIQRFFCAEISEDRRIGASPVVGVDHEPLRKSGIAFGLVVEVVESLVIEKSFETVLDRVLRGSPTFGVM